jgi:hypothetical protein
MQTGAILDRPVGSGSAKCCFAPTEMLAFIDEEQSSQASPLWPVQHRLGATTPHRCLIDIERKLAQ